MKGRVHFLESAKVVIYPVNVWKVFCDAYIVVMKPLAPSPLSLIAFFVLVVCCLSANGQTPPRITGQPLYFDAGVLNWPTDREPAAPDLTEAVSNRLFDLHMEVNECAHFDLIISTAGNWHPALTDFWFNRFLRKQKKLQNWYFTTTPPVALEQVQNAHFGVGNLSVNCVPHIAIGPQPVMDALAEAGLTEGEPLPLLTTRGDVILVQRGNPKNIRTVHDLGRKDVRLATPDPETESGSFGHYTRTLYGVAYNAFGKETSDTLFSKIFNANDSTWVAGRRIHHRELPEIIARGEADAGIFFYQLARYVTDLFPDRFDIVPLGGGLNAPDPLQGNERVTLLAVRLRGDLSENALALREAFFEEIEKGKLDRYIKGHYMDPAER